MEAAVATSPDPGPPRGRGEVRRLAIDPEVSRIRVEARTSVGPVEWVADGMSGECEVSFSADGTPDLDGPASGSVEVDLARFTSGNRVYDGELLRRIDARRHPVATVVLESAVPVTGQSLGAQGQVTLHGVPRTVSGTLRVQVDEDGSVLVRGDQTIDIRDFGLPAPTMLMLKVYPDVRVSLALVARPV